jgi:hypothetical protein
MHENRPTVYVSRRVERPTHVVIRDAETFLTRRGWQPVDGTGPRTLAARRTFRGVLRAASGRRIGRVELEVGAWSEDASELGLRPLGFRARRAATRRAYGEAAVGLLDALAHPARRAPAPRRSAARLRRAS